MNQAALVTMLLVLSAAGHSCFMTTLCCPYFTIKGILIVR